MAERGERLLVVGGRQRRQALDLDEWQAYESGIVLEIDPDRGDAQVVIEYQSPPEVCAEENPSIVFKAGTLREDGQRLLLCTQTEIIEYCTSTWQPTFYFSHPWFNDLHHVCYRISGETGDEHFLMANTGLDQVIELAVDRQQPAASSIARSWSTCSTPTWSRFDQGIDYRRVATTKPHHSHPNFVFQFEDRLYATRFHQQDALELTADGSRIPLPQGNPHDGVVRGKQVLFTTTNGHFVSHDLETGTPGAAWDLNVWNMGSESLGWCRGIAPLDESQIWVGFSRIRPTWLRKNLSWIKQGFRHRGEYGTRPTRIAKYDLSGPGLLCDIELERYGMNAVFGIHVCHD